MSKPFFNNGLFPRKSASFAARTAVILFSALAVAPSVRADLAGQNELNSILHTNVGPSATILNCTAAQLATAVADAIADHTSFTPGDLARCAVQAYPDGQPGETTRSDLDSVAPLVVGAAIRELVNLHTDTTFGQDVACITDNVIDANEPNPSWELSLSAREAVAQRAVATIADAYVSGTTGAGYPEVTIVQADKYLGRALAADTFLEGLPDNDDTSIIASALLGITGTSGADTLGVVNSAGVLMVGVVEDGTVPNAQSFPVFAVAALKNVSSNASVDEYVAYELGQYDNNAAPAGLISMAEALFTAYPADKTKITQGLTDAITKGNANEVNRISFVSTLTTDDVADAVNILQGGVFADPYYAGGTSTTTGFTYAVFNAVYAASPSTLVSDATSAAIAVGNVLGRDGDALTQVAETYSKFVGTGALLASMTATYATDLITGAINGPYPDEIYFLNAPTSGGDTLNIGNSSNVPTQTVIDLASITDVLADGIITRFGSSLNSNATTAATYIGALAEAVAKFTGNAPFLYMNNPNRAGSVGVFLAATLDNYIVGLGLNSTTETDILNAIKTHVEVVVTNSTDDSLINTEETDAEANNGSDIFAAITGPINVQETTVTNL